jgi:hypothetical protein
VVQSGITGCGVCIEYRSTWIPWTEPLYNRVWINKTNHGVSGESVQISSLVCYYCDVPEERTRGDNGEALEEVNEQGD